MGGVEDFGLLHPILRNYLLCAVAHRYVLLRFLVVRRGRLIEICFPWVWVRFVE